LPLPIHRHLTVAVADKFVDDHPDFKLIIVLRDAHENALISVVNFTVTKMTLKAQLLTLAISTELPELEERLKIEL
jgi:hypothetical protein